MRWGPGDMCCSVSDLGFASVESELYPIFSREREGHWLRFFNKSHLWARLPHVIRWVVLCIGDVEYLTHAIFSPKEKRKKSKGKEEANLARNSWRTERQKEAWIRQWSGKMKEEEPCHGCVPALAATPRYGRFSAPVFSHPRISSRPLLTLSLSFFCKTHNNMRRSSVAVGGLVMVSVLVVVSTKMEK